MIITQEEKELILKFRKEKEEKTKNEKDNSNLQELYIDMLNRIFYPIMNKIEKRISENSEFKKLMEQKCELTILSHLLDIAKMLERRKNEHQKNQ